MSDQNDRSMQDLKPTVWIGKQGCTATMIEEIVAQLKKRNVIKVKWLQNTEVDPEAIAAEAKAVLVEVRGKTMVLKEKKRSAPVVKVAKPVKPVRSARSSSRPAKK
jgi:RNA-binding protein